MRRGRQGDLMELNGWVSPQMLTRYVPGARSARTRRTYYVGATAGILECARTATQ